jgi:hypothetical protein
MHVMRAQLACCLVAALCIVAAVDVRDCTPPRDQNHRGNGRRYTTEFAITSNTNENGEGGQVHSVRVEAVVRPGPGESQDAVNYVRTLQVLHYDNPRSSTPHLVSTTEFDHTATDAAATATALVVPEGKSGEYFKAYVRASDGVSILACGEFGV